MSSVDAKWSETSKYRILKDWQYYLQTSSRFFEYQANEICSHRVKRRQMAAFLGPISSKITLTKVKERRERKIEEEEGRRREKSNGCILSFYNG